MMPDKVGNFHQRKVRCYEFEHIVPWEALICKMRRCGYWTGCPRIPSDATHKCERCGRTFHTGKWETCGFCSGDIAEVNDA